MSLVRLLFAFLCVGVAAAAEYAVFVTGAAVWLALGYAQDATMFHAYQLLKGRGVPRENMYVMTMDSVAHDKRNKEPGILRNVPGGPNVYDHSAIDYRGKDNFTVDTFLNVIQGNATGMKEKGSGRVLDSTENDNVFIYYMDHGGRGSVVFPGPTNWGSLTKEMFQAAVKNMHQKKMFKKLVVYMEACYAGSMGEDFPTDINVLFVTPDTPWQPTVATHCHDNKENTCLAALWGLTWIQNAAKMGPTETLEAQFKAVSTSVQSQKIHPCMYGNVSMASEQIGDFMGKSKWNIPEQVAPPAVDAVALFDAPLMMLKKELKAAETAEQREILISKISETVAHQAKVDTIFTELQQYASSTVDDLHPMWNECGAASDLQCERSMQQAFDSVCGEDPSYYVLKYATVFSQLCADGYTPSVVKEVASRHCQ